LKKTTFETCYNLIPKSFLFFLLFANLVSATGKCAVFSNGVIGISLSQTPLYDGVLLHNCIDKKSFFQENTSSSTQNLFLILEEKTVAMSLFVEIKNLSKVFYCQNSLFFGDKVDGYISFSSYAFVANDQTESERLFISLVTSKDECYGGLGSEGTNADIIKNFMFSH